MTEHPPPNNPNSAKKEDASDNKKESILENAASKLLAASTSFLNNTLNSILDEDDVTATLGLRVPARVYNYYRRSLGLREQHLVREVLKQVFVNLVLGKADVVLSQKSVSINLNVNVQQVVEAERGDENIVKLRREIERLREELARVTAENVDLRNELEKLRRQRDELQHQLLRSSVRVQDKSDKLLEDALFALAVVAECIESDCSKQKLLEFVKREYEKMLQHATPPKKEIIDVYVKHLKG